MKFEKVLITGGSRGIGRQLVKIFLNKGSEVHAISRNFHDEFDSPQFKFHSLDLSNTNETSFFAKNFIKKYGVPDLLINNAGEGAFYEWHSFPEDDIQKQINLLFTAPVLLCRLFAPHMTESGKGKIVNITSLATIFPVPFMPIYNSCKSALSSFSRSMQLEYQSKQVFIDVILGDVKTDFNEKLRRSSSNRWAESTKIAWSQVKKQLDESPTPDLIAKRLVSKICKSSGGIVYEGGWTQRVIYSRLGRLVPSFLKNIILQRRYFK